MKLNGYGPEVKEERDGSVFLARSSPCLGHMNSMRNRYAARRGEPGTGSRAVRRVVGKVTRVCCRHPVIGKVHRYRVGQNTAFFESLFGTTWGVRCARVLAPT